MDPMLDHLNRLHEHLQQLQADHAAQMAALSIRVQLLEQGGGGDTIAPNTLKLNAEGHVE